MSQFTTFAENQLADFARGQGITLPDEWHLAFLTMDSDGEWQEITDMGLERVPVARSLAAWAGTHGAGTILASTGTSHATSNNEDIPMGEATGSNGPVLAEAVGLFSGDSDGELWMVWEMTAPLLIEDEDTPVIDAGTMGFSLGLAGGMSNYLSNRLIDLIFRGQAYSWPASLYVAAYTAAPSNAGGGTEIGGGVGYARAEIESTMDDWSGTQGPATTDPSDGDAGRISNNVAVTFPAPTGNQGTWSHGGLHDSAVGGNLMWWRTLAAQRTVSAGGPAPNFPPDSLGITWD